ncbi:hypothetical protein N7449_006541 [Penicillium cf. viridicatum]|uniref:PRISE-like Rossmann-fold domain-containing protein n=1 Tax=Penicillium cf. viridicatum TaxID=2972119 RepID=A0A9W9JHI4_9EURO|nr:hypothetical protein N7449_006541 [Penicillium cf. viridicatum]
MAELKKVALVFGASGISGWAVTKCALFYPTPTTFDRVIGLTNRPLPLEKSGLPHDPRLELHYGVNLRENLDEVISHLQEKVPNLKDSPTCIILCQPMALANWPHNYGVAVFRFQEHIEINPPLREDNPRIPSPWGDEIFYYAQVDLIKEANKGKSWKWCKVRPDQIVGHVPIPTIMTYVEPLALYLMLYRYLNGSGATVVFPAPYANYIHTYTSSSQDIIARSELYLSVEKPDQTHGEALNTAENATPESWAVVWPKMCEYFGLNAEGARPEDKGWTLTSGGSHTRTITRRCAKSMVCTLARFPRRLGFSFQQASASWVATRELSLDKIRTVGFTEEDPIAYGYFQVFDHLAQEKIIPSKEA